MANKPAGMRTHMLVAGSAALLVLVSEALLAQLGAELRPGTVRGDPIRIVLSVVTGVAFLGAGAIIRPRGSSIEGLTTAGTILLAAAVGISVAAKELVLAGGTTFLVVVTLRVLAHLEQRLKRGPQVHGPQDHG